VLSPRRLGRHLGFPVLGSAESEQASSYHIVSAPNWLDKLLLTIVCFMALVGMEHIVCLMAVAGIEHLLRPVRTLN
jgi:hypothetical protein